MGVSKCMPVLEVWHTEALLPLYQGLGIGAIPDVLMVPERVLSSW